MSIFGVKHRTKSFVPVLYKVAKIVTFGAQELMEGGDTFITELYHKPGLRNPCIEWVILEYRHNSDKNDISFTPFVWLN